MKPGADSVQQAGAQVLEVWQPPGVLLAMASIIEEARGSSHWNGSSMAVTWVNRSVCSSMT
jgi:hypothetical protein